MNRKVLVTVLALGFVFAGCAAPAHNGENDNYIYEPVESNLPFPQQAGITYVNRVMPSTRTQAQMNQDVIDQFKKIMQDFLIEPNTPNSNNSEHFRMALSHQSGGGASKGQITCSESMGYGMLMLAYMAGADEHFRNNSISNQNLKVVGDRQLTIKCYFDGMFRSLMNWPTTQGTQISGKRYLMAWELVTDTAGGSWRNTGSSASSATDGDLDMAYALLLADKQWGSDGRYNYRDYALKMIQSMWNDIVDRSNNSYHLKVGNWAGTGASGSSRVSRPSDFMLGHLRTYKAVDTANDWQAVINATNNIIGQITNQQNPVNGLLPGFVILNRSTGIWTPNQSGQNGGAWNESAASDHRYDWNACRVPWRLGTDILVYGDSNIQYGPAPLKNITLGNTCIKPLYEFLLRGSTNAGGAGNSFSAVSRNHFMDGTGAATGAGSAYSSPVALAAAAYGTPSEMESAWSYMRNLSRQNNQYGDYINVLCMIAASGNWWAPELRN